MLTQKNTFGELGKKILPKRQELLGDFHIKLLLGVEISSSLYVIPENIIEFKLKIGKKTDFIRGVLMSYDGSSSNSKCSSAKSNQQMARG